MYESTFIYLFPKGRVTDQYDDKQTVHSIDATISYDNVLFVDHNVWNSTCRYEKEKISELLNALHHSLHYFLLLLLLIYNYSYHILINVYIHVFWPFISRIWIWFSLLYDHIILLHCQLTLENVGKFYDIDNIICSLCACATILVVKETGDIKFCIKTG